MGASEGASGSVDRCPALRTRRCPSARPLARRRRRLGRAPGGARGSVGATRGGGSGGHVARGCAERGSQPAGAPRRTAPGPAAPNPPNPPPLPPPPQPSRVAVGWKTPAQPSPPPCPGEFELSGSRGRGDFVGQSFSGSRRLFFSLRAGYSVTLTGVNAASGAGGAGGAPRCFSGPQLLRRFPDLKCRE